MPDVPRFQRKTAFRVHTLSDQDITVAAGPTFLNFHVTRYDLGNNYDLATDTYNTPLDGIYAFTAYVVTIALGTGDSRFNVSLFRNGLEDSKGTDNTTRGLQINDIRSFHVATELNAFQNDTIRIRVHNVAGPTQRVIGGALSWFTGHRIESESRTILGG